MSDNLTLHIPGRLEPQPVTDLAHASRLYSQLREDSREGYSTFRSGYVSRNGEQFATVSYNGRIWGCASVYQVGEAPLIYDPFGKVATPA